MTLKMIRTAAAVAIALISTSVFAEDVTGAGASFPAPVYAKWASMFNTATKWMNLSRSWAKQLTFVQR